MRLRYPERRTGFDRRSGSGVLVWYRDRPAVIAVALGAIVALNLADYALTLRALDLGAAEANPIMAALLEQGSLPAGVFKMLTAVVVVAIIWRFRRYKNILGVSLIALGGFGVLLVYQIALVVVLG